MTSTPAVVVLSARLGPVLPAAAVRVLQDGAVLQADTDLPPELAEQFGARPAGPAEAGDDAGGETGEAVRGILLTLDRHTGHAARWVAAGAPVLVTPEPPGARLLDAVAVMDRLRSPGGCPWDAEQTHSSLMPYLIEETYELYQALEDGDPDALREELGDVLLQVLFHARVAQEPPQETPREKSRKTPQARSGAVVGATGFDIDAVAGELVGKLVGRHPHVFARSEQVHTAAEQEIRWEQLKRTEKHRDSAVDGVALAQPALALVAKLVSRAARAGLPADLLPTAGGGAGQALFAQAGAAKLTGQDPEAAARTVARRFADDVRAAERSARAAGLDPAALTADQWRAHWPRPGDGAG